jgi:3-oxoacyl-[acyl-carrier protein] reductase
LTDAQEETMDLQLEGKTALVTGASQGLGRAIARMLAMEGVTVAGAARRIDDVAHLAREVKGVGGAQIIPLSADLYPEGAAEQLADTALKELGRVDILINAAGGSRPLTLESPKEAWVEGMLLNFFRLRELTQALIPSMRAQKFGRVVNLTGTSEPRAVNAAVSAKAAVHVWSKGLACEVARDGVTVNCLKPGKFRTEQIQRRWPTEESELEFAAKTIPIGRFGTPEEFATMAVFLSSPLAGYITGTAIAVDGGSSHFAL